MDRYGKLVAEMNTASGGVDEVQGRCCCAKRGGAPLKQPPLSTALLEARGAISRDRPSRDDAAPYARPILQRRFPRPWRFEPIPGGSRVIHANGLALAHVYGEPPSEVASSDKRLTDDEAERLARLPELVDLEKDRIKARSRRKPQPPRVRPETVGDLINSGRLLEVHCSSARHLYIDVSSLELPKRLPVPEVANHLVWSV